MRFSAIWQQLVLVPPGQQLRLTPFWPHNMSSGLSFDVLDFSDSECFMRVCVSALWMIWTCSSEKNIYLNYLAHIVLLNVDDCLSKCDLFQLKS